MPPLSGSRANGQTRVNAVSTAMTPMPIVNTFGRCPKNENGESIALLVRF